MNIKNLLPAAFYAIYWEENFFFVAFINQDIHIAAITVNIYEGYLEDSVLFESFSTLSSTTTNLDVPVNKLYTITATYSREAKYIVINSVTPRVLYDEASCDEPCYYVYDRKVDLRLKYTK